MNKQTSEQTVSETGARDLAVSEFSFTVFDLYTGIEKEIMAAIYNMAEELRQPMLRGPFYSIVYEMTVNALKALYKRVYYDFFVAEIGLDDIAYEDWLRLFKTEIEAHQAENFARFCREQNLSVSVCSKHVDDNFVIEVINEGVPSEVEYRRLQKCIERAKSNSGPAFLFEDENRDTDNDDGEREGGGLGITLIITTLRNLGISTDNFVVDSDDGKHTSARLILPLSAFRN